MHRYRSHTCADLRPDHVGSAVRLAGWVHRVRDHGGVLFIDLRDHYGITQVLADSDSPAFAEVERLRAETCIRIDGTVKARDASLVNPRLPTGEIEVYVRAIEVLGPAEELPLPVFGEPDYPEDTRLTYRFLDLRRDGLHANMMLRSNVVRSMRQRMWDAGFTEFQTPIITASSPEGARDFLVPSRLHPGRFYALPQAPQQFKQLIMVAGFDRYFQIAPCFRDEDPRADRSPTDFYQLDVEMSFVTQDDVFAAMEPVVRGVFEEFGGGRPVTPVFPRIPYAEAMLKYGSDKPDLRFGLEIREAGEIFAESNFRVFRETLDSGGVVRGLAVPGGASLSLKQLEELTEFCRRSGAGGLLWILFKEGGGLKSPIKKFLSEGELARLRETFSCSEGDSLMLIADRPEKAAEVLGRLRLKLAADLGLIPKDRYEFLWVVDFPLFGYNPEEKRFEAVHHPFTSPHLEDLELLETDPGKVRSRAYDLVLNGTELGGGSIRIHREEVQKKMFALLNIGSEEAESRFGFLLEALRHGAPPHGGIALGLDRLLMLMGGLSSIRDVITFPKTQKAICLTTGSPSGVDPRQIKELHIALTAPDR